MVVSDFHVFIRDSLQHIDLMKKDHPGLPVFLLGHSMVSTWYYPYLMESWPLVEKQKVLLSLWPFLSSPLSFSLSFEVNRDIKSYYNLLKYNRRARCRVEFG